jgi:DNA-directed RNA polymerase subunit RPC12/RpoP
MAATTQHTMMRTGSTPSGAEEWWCPHCGRRLLVQWRPFEKVVLDPGDERVQHVGAKGGMTVGTADVRPVPDTLPEEQRRWLAENGIAWDDDAA